MSDTKIEWSQAVWNPLAGCTPVSAGCRNCYASNHARRLAGNPNPKVSEAYEGTARTAGDGRAVFTGKVNLLPERLKQPLRWRKPRRVFVNSMSDLFHEDVPEDFIDRVFAVMALAQQHTFQILTKRPERMAEYFASKHLRIPEVSFDGAQRLLGIDGDGGTVPWPLPNVWLGTSTEDQAAADQRIPHLLRTPAAVRFLSCEPLLGPVDLGMVADHRGHERECIDGKPWPQCLDCSTEEESVDWTVPAEPRLHWVIIGGESGPSARPCDVEWIRSLVRQCQEAGVPAFVKQLGASWYEQLALVRPTQDRKGGDPREWPEDLRVRRFPQTAEVPA